MGQVPIAFFSFVSFDGLLLQQREIHLVIIVNEEHIPAVVPPLDDACEP